MGFYYTATNNLKYIKSFLPDVDKLSGEQREDIKAKIDEMLEFFDSVPKNRTWRARAKVGDKKKWYRPVESSATVGEFSIFSAKHLRDTRKE